VCGDLGDGGGDSDLLHVETTPLKSMTKKNSPTSAPQPAPIYSHTERGLRRARGFGISEIKNKSLKIFSILFLLNSKLFFSVI
jgi:hypothetical protein